MTAVFGVATFLAFVLFAVQVLLHLAGTSTVSAAAFDAARLVAAEDGISCAGARVHVTELLGAYGRRVTVTCSPGVDEVEVAVVGPSPAPIVGGFLGGFDLGRIERTARVRVELFRAPTP